MPIRSGDKAPYAPPATVIQVIEGYRDRGLTTPFTQDVLLRAGVTESLASRTLVALEALDLIDDQGNPTDAFEGLRRATSEEYQDRLAEVVRGAYAEVFQFTDPANDPRSRIEDAFRSYDPAGQRRRMVILFLGLCQAAGIVAEDTVQTRETPRRRSSSTSKQAQGGSEARVSVKAATAPKRRAPQPEPPAEQLGGVHPAVAGLIRSIPSNGASWTTGEREAFLETFKAVVNYAVPIKEKDERPQTESLEA